jgi:hypothetical protein
MNIKGLSKTDSFFCALDLVRGYLLILCRFISASYL